MKKGSNVILKFNVLLQRNCKVNKTSTPTVSTIAYRPMTMKSATPALGSRSFTPECPIAYAVAQSNLKTSGSQTGLTVFPFWLCFSSGVPRATCPSQNTNRYPRFLLMKSYWFFFNISGICALLFILHTHRQYRVQTRPCWIIGALITAPSHYLAVRLWARDTTSLCVIVLIWKQRMTTVTTSELPLYM